MSDFTLTIDGQSVAAEDSFGVINPSTGEVFAQAPECTRAQLDRAMEAADAAFPAWSQDIEQRRKVLKDCAELLRGRAQDLAPILTREQGKPVKKAMVELMGASAWFDYAATLELPVEVVQDDERARVEVHRRPLGVVAAITPWNFPIILASWKIGPALLAGNTLVIKPSPFTPLSTLALGEALREVVPPGVINVVSGGDDLGKWMTSHPVPRKISFTGSVETGKHVAASAAPDLKRVTLELGGNDAAILLPDVDPAAIAEKLFWGAFDNVGQVCSAIKRVYVHEDKYEATVSALAERARRTVVGDGFDEKSEIGPLNNRPQFERVQELVEDAVQAGATVVTGGSAREGGGYFFEPTILTDVAEGVRIVDEEQFGPAVPVLPYRDVDDAVERANRSHYGLSGSVWSGDLKRAAEVASKLDCGTAWVNQHVAIAPHIPFGGAKWSGIGVENGPWGLYGFTEIRALNISKK